MLLKCMSLFIGILLPLSLPSLCISQTLPSETAPSDTAMYGPTLDSSYSTQAVVDTISSSAGDTSIQLQGSSLVSRCLDGKTADIRFYGIKTVTGYGPYTLGGGLSLGVGLFHGLRVGGDISWVGASGHKGYGVFAVSISHSRQLGGSWSLSLVGYAGPSLSSRDGDRPKAGVAGNICLYVPNTLPHEQRGAIGLYAEPYYESEGRFGVRVGFARFQPH